MAQKEKFGDIIENHELIKRTLMVAAYPALIKQVEKDGEKSFEGFLPGFEFAQVSDIFDEDEIVEVLQDMLDDEVEELVVFGKSLPFVEEDDELMEKYPDHKIIYLDINVYATKEELDYYDGCTHDCASCGHHCDCGDEECFDDDCDCEDHCDCEDEDECDCGCHHDEDCNCEDDECDCGCNEEHDKKCTCHEHEHKENHKCNCGSDKENKKSNCKSKNKNNSKK